MAHEIDSVFGVVPAAFSNTVPWHSLGTIFDEGGKQGMTSDEAIRLSSLDGTYSLEEVASVVDGTPLPNTFGVFYSHTRHKIKVGVGNVGNRYQVVQPSECFNVLDNLMRDGIIYYESAFALRGYQKICLLARMPGDDTVAEGDTQLRYIACSNAYTGDECLEFLPTSVRVVCANTKRLAWDLGKHLCWSIRHTGDMAEKLEMARKYLAQFNAKFDDYRDKARFLATRKWSKEDALAYINTLFPPVVDKDGKPVTEGRAFTRRENKVEEIRAAYRNPTNVVRSIQGSWWALFNAVTFAADHPAGKFKGKNPREEAESRYLSVMDGTVADLKDTAFDLACKMAGIQTATAA